MSSTSEKCILQGLVSSHRIFRKISPHGRSVAPKTSHCGRFSGIPRYLTTSSKAAGLRLCAGPALADQVVRGMSQGSICFSRIRFPRSADQLPSASYCTGDLQGSLETPMDSVTVYECYTRTCGCRQRDACSQSPPGSEVEVRHCDSARSMLLCLASVTQATALRGSRG
jgi:hypothetical protein